SSARGRPSTCAWAAPTRGSIAWTASPRWCSAARPSTWAAPTRTSSSRSLLPSPRCTRFRPSTFSTLHNESNPMSPATAELSAAELHRGPLTFMGAPFSHDLSAAKAAILGAPFDCGIHLFRIGARQGPQSIREQSRLVRPFQSEFADYDIRARLRLLDCGHAAVMPGRIEPSVGRIEEAAFRIVSAGAVPIGFGGDGSVSLPLIRAAARRWPNLAVLHVDSHTDAYPYEETEPYTAATQFTHAAL